MLDIIEPNEKQNKLKIWRFPMFGKDMFSGYGVKDAEHMMSGFVAAIQTMGEDCECSQCDLYAQIYTSETVIIEAWCWWKAGVNAKWILEQLASDWETGFNSRRHRQWQQKRFAKDAPRWHHVKSIRGNMDVLNHSNTKPSSLSAGENCGGSASA